MYVLAFSCLIAEADGGVSPTSDVFFHHNLEGHFPKWAIDVAGVPSDPSWGECTCTCASVSPFEGEAGWMCRCGGSFDLHHQDLSPTTLHWGENMGCVEDFLATTPSPSATNKAAQPLMGMEQEPLEGLEEEAHHGRQQPPESHSECRYYFFCCLPFNSS